MRVLHLLRSLANSSGPTFAVLNLSRQLVERGADVTVFHLSGLGLDTVDPADERIRVEGFPVTCEARWGYSRRLRQALRDRMPSFDIVHIHSLWMHLGFAAARIASRHGVPYIAAPHGSLDAWCLRQGRLHKSLYGALVERSLLNGATCIHALTANEIRDVRAFGVSAPCVIVPNGIEADACAGEGSKTEHRRALGLADTDLVVLSMSRLHPKKGIDVLLRAAGALAPRWPALRLIVAGSDRGSGYAATLERLTGELGIRETVTFTGEVRGETKQAVLAAADVFALPSHSEGLPVAVLEAMACGLPAVISKPCNLPEVDEAEAGHIVEPEAQAVQAALEELARAPDRRRMLGENARRLVAQSFTWERIGGRLHRLYGDILAGKLTPDSPSAPAA